MRITVYSVSADMKELVDNYITEFLSHYLEPLVILITLGVILGVYLCFIYLIVDNYG